MNESQAGIKTVKKNINNLRYADDITLNGRKERVTKESLDEDQRESEKNGLKHNIQKTKIIASSPINSWQIDEENWKQWQILFSWAPKFL